LARSRGGSFVAQEFSTDGPGRKASWLDCSAGAGSRPTFAGGSALPAVPLRTEFQPFDGVLDRRPRAQFLGKDGPYRSSAPVGVSDIGWSEGRALICPQRSEAAPTGASSPWKFARVGATLPPAHGPGCKNPPPRGGGGCQEQKGGLTAISSHSNYRLADFPRAVSGSARRGRLKPSFFLSRSWTGRKIRGLRENSRGLVRSRVADSHSLPAGQAEKKGPEGGPQGVFLCRESVRQGRGLIRTSRVVSLRPGRKEVVISGLIFAVGVLKSG